MRNITATICLMTAVLVGSTGCQTASLISAKGLTGGYFPPCVGKPSITPWTDCYGAYHLSDGTKYVGEFYKNIAYGQGTLTFVVPHERAGIKYVGEFDNDLMHGRGTMTVVEPHKEAGLKFIGGWEHGKIHGRGTTTYVWPHKKAGLKFFEVWDEGELIYAIEKIESPLISIPPPNPRVLKNKKHRRASTGDLESRPTKLKSLHDESLVSKSEYNAKKAEMLKGLTAAMSGDYATALRELEPLAKQGHAKAQGILGLMYYRGNGVLQDDRAAVKWWRLAAQQGVDKAQFNLGLMYSKGRGVPQDYKAALKWYTLAAQQGHAKAQHNLGNMYARGQGVLKDNMRAHMWFNIAITSGSKKSSRNRNIIAKRMNANQLEKTQSLARECIRKKFKGC